MTQTELLAGTKISELDAALMELGRFGPELANGMTSHAPMVVEALEALGRSDAIGPWVTRNRAMLLPWPATLQDDSRDPELGDWRAVSNWRRVFAQDLRSGDWRGVLARWVPQFAAGASAHALHGLIRTAHAARSIGRVETPGRLAELAAALASWAAAYAELPVTPDGGNLAGISVGDAVARLSFLPNDRRQNAGSIVGALAQLTRQDDFARAFHWPAFANVESDIREMGALFAQVFAANANSTLHAVVFTHGVTGSAAALHLLPYLSKADARTLARHVWHACSALYVVYGNRPPAKPAQPVYIVPEMMDLAIIGGDDHAIKLAEALLALDVEQDLACAVLKVALNYLGGTE